jgi:hypothetical protein
MTPEEYGEGGFVTLAREVGQQFFVRPLGMIGHGGKVTDVRQETSGLCCAHVRFSSTGMARSPTIKIIPGEGWRHQTFSADVLTT